jgi:hypothetical protein
MYINLAIEFCLTCIALLNLVVDLLIALQNLPTAQLLPSSASYGTLYSDLLRLGSLVDMDGFNIEWIFPLLRAVLNKESNRVI